MPYRKNVAVIGVGSWGAKLAQTLDHLGALGALADSNFAVHDELHNRFPELPIYDRSVDVFHSPEIERVVIATPPKDHYLLAKEALLSGKDVFVEKPLCYDVGDAERLIGLATDNDRILMVGHLLQFHPYIRRLQQMVEQGSLGKLRYIFSNRLSLGGIGSARNVLWHAAPEDISVFLSLAGAFPEETRCMGTACLGTEAVDTNLTTLRFPNEVQAHLYATRVSPVHQQHLVAICSGGTAVFDDRLHWEEKLQIFRDPIQFDGGGSFQGTYSKGQCVIEPELDPVEEELIHFLDACEHRRLPRTDGEEALRVLRVLEAAENSLTSTGEELIDDSESGEYYAHPTAEIDKGAVIGQGSKIWHFSHVMPSARLGAGCHIGQNVVIHDGVHLGDGCKIQNNVSILRGVHMEDRIFVGPGVAFCNVRRPRAEQSLRHRYEKTMIRTGVTIGANATVVSGVELGTYCFVAAGSVVTQDVRPHQLVKGNPARPAGWVSRHGQPLDLPIQVPDGECFEAFCPESGEHYELGDDGVYLLQNKAAFT